MAAAWQQAEVLVLWASETGAGEDISQQIASRAREAHGIDAAAVSLADVAAEAPAVVTTLNSMGGGHRRALVFVASSTGAGEPPENSVKFMTLLRRARRKLKGPSAAEAPALRPPTALLGLGDSNYTDYQANPRCLAALLEDVGAAFFYERGEADEATGLEDDVERWISGLWEPLKSAMERSAAAEEEESGAAADGDAKKEKEKEKAKKRPSKFAGKIRKRKTVAQQLRWTLSTVAPASPPPLLTSATEFPACAAREGLTPITVTAARWLTAEDATKQALEVLLDLSRLPHPDRRPGDAVAIRCPNPEAEVEAVLARLEVEGERRVAVEVPAGVEEPPSHVAALEGTTARDFLTWGVDLRGLVKKSALAALAECAADAAEKAQLLLLSSREGKEAYEAQFEAERPTLVEVLERFPSCSVSLTTVARLWPRAQPRHYSYASDPSSGSAVRVVFSLAQYRTPGGVERKGLCTHWLASKCVEQGFVYAREGLPERSGVKESRPLVISGFHKASTAFRMDTDAEALARPFLMVGPGTGVAPFLAFLERRQQIARSSPSTAMGFSWLFFGCRSADKDEIYRPEIDSFLEAGVLARRTVAYSRQDAQIVYVQHQLEQHGAELADLLLNQNARLFVCGDAKGMAVGVHTSLVTILSTYGKLSNKEALTTKTRLLVERQLVFDVWF